MINYLTNIWEIQADELSNGWWVELWLGLAIIKYISLYFIVEFLSLRQSLACLATFRISFAFLKADTGNVSATESVCIWAKVKPIHTSIMFCLSDYFPNRISRTVFWEAHKNIKLSRRTPRSTLACAGKFLATNRERRRVYAFFNNLLEQYEL